MLVSCICVCHNKPDLTPEAIQSIVDQSYPHWEAIVVDSGVLYDAGYYDPFPWRRDPRVKLIRSDETEEIRRTKAMAPWCYNECFRKGLVSGDLVMYLCDDDILYPNAFATFVSYCRQYPAAVAMYAGQDVAMIYPNGWRALVGERRATGPGGRSCQGRRMDCHVDYLQFCHKAAVLDWFPDHEYWPESKDSETHADGLFMERIGLRAPIYPIDVKVSQNRRTSRSTYVPVGSFPLVECMANGIPLLPTPPAGAGSRFPLPSPFYAAAEGAAITSPLSAGKRALISPRPCTRGRGVGGEGGEVGHGLPPHPQPLSPEYRGEGRTDKPRSPAYRDEGRASNILWMMNEKRSDCRSPALEDAVPLVTISVACHNPSDCLAETLASVAGQTYPNLDVLVINDCSADDKALQVFDAMRMRYPRFRFLRQDDSGDRVVRDRGLSKAQGTYFIPMDADTLACPEMVERLVAAMRRNPKLSALTCYLAAFAEAGHYRSELETGAFPRKEGSDLLVSMKNVYSGGIFHTAKFREVGGYATAWEIPGQQWIGFLNLVQHGCPIDILPEHLFYYQPTDTGPPRNGDDAPKRESLLSRFLPMDRQLASERVALWTAFASMQQRLEQMAEQNHTLRERNLALEIRCAALRYQVADRLTMLCGRFPFIKRGIQWLLRSKGHGRQA